MVVQQGDIFWVHIPDDAHTIGSEQKKDRPYVIVSRTGVNSTLGRIVVGVPLSTKTSKAGQYRILIPAKHIIKEPKSTSQLDAVDRVALTEQIRVLDVSRLEQPRVAYLTDVARNGVLAGLAFLFDIR